MHQQLVFLGEPGDGGLKNVADGVGGTLLSRHLQPHLHSFPHLIAHCNSLKCTLVREVHFVTALAVVLHPHHERR